MKVKSPFLWAGAVCVGFALLMGLSAPASMAAETAPVHIAFVGDSMADGLWGALFRRLGKDKCLADRIKLIRKAKNGTGLARLDQFNWVAEVGAMAKDGGPDLFVGSFGINDRQAIVDASRVRTEYDAPDFDTRYQSFAEDLVRNAIAGGASILVAGLPVMLDPAANADARNKNRLFAAAVADVGSPLAAYVKPWSSQAGDDEYKPYLPNADNRLVQFRANDGVHFTTTGYDQVMDYFYPFIMNSLKLRGRDILSECSK
ncbi:GDSL-type esterase/lipase family protein [Methylocapsa sp. S129]|uniref:DUF459 domain-containing protein n=1 Tax=Methylocapsa sp. S129 TaxID=1641869 RepID=UPI00131BCBD5|nr:GDSL-type esterase/lipase family protein [Methylocapsa sp. S129]